MEGLFTTATHEEFDGPGYEAEAATVDSESGGYEESTGASASSTQEDEFESSEGSARSSTRSGVRDVTELRVSYRCQ